MAEPRGQSALFQVHLHQLDAQKWSAAGAPMLWSVVGEASAEGWAGRRVVKPESISVANTVNVCECVSVCGRVGCSQ